MDGATAAPAPPVDEGPPPETEDEILARIFWGDFENIPSIASKIVRIFTSSTFTGM